MEIILTIIQVICDLYLINFNQRNKRCSVIILRDTQELVGKAYSKWRAYVKVDSKLINLGSFYTLEIAIKLLGRLT